MRKTSTHFLRFAVFVMGLGVLAFCIFALPEVWIGGPLEFPMAKQGIYMIVIIWYITAVPFYIALAQTLKLLNYIDKNTAFSELSVKALRVIKYCAVTMAILYWVCEPAMFAIADADDAPGLVVIWAAFASAPIVIAVFAAVLQRLLQGAIEMKSENELTV